MNKLTFLLSFLFIATITSGQKNISALFNVVQTNNHFDFEDITGQAYPFSPRINFATSEQIGLSTRVQNQNNFFWEILVAGAKGSSYHINGPISPDDSNFKAYQQLKSDLHLRVEIGKMFTHESLPRFSYGFSGSIDPRITVRNYEPTRTSMFEMKLQTYGAALNVNPQIEININDKIIVTLKMPLELANYVYIDGAAYDPNKNAENQMISRDIIDLFLLRPNVSFGVGYYFTHQDR
ncbi:hypothetical protein [Portibacter lacus]|uniref:Uncharacterized protein n=1 Tax=Portibacter lacus TaxID=1099794 RepID=A0AA37SJD2_9BACT|nr:hypothetical protein [Portibacter lacus]GLR15848.1 hypothetical protein GCM10007940_04630 [Portibacter lacus]